MIWESIITALALMLVFEGIMPFISPAAMRKALLQVLQLNDKTLRIIGAGSMLSGLILIYLVK